MTTILERYYSLSAGEAGQQALRALTKLYNFFIVWPTFAVLETLTSIHVNSTLEPNRLSRDDGKSPDGMTLVRWIKGQPLVWDVTIVDTLADSYVLKTSEVSGFAAEMACKRTHSKYSSIISSNYVFKGL
jgi:hypothetical protein